MEIERKYLVSEVPANLKDYHCRVIEQGYLSTHPVVRVRKDNDSYYLTYKGSGMMAREEYNLPRSPMNICLPRQTAILSPKDAMKSRTEQGKRLNWIYLKVCFLD